MQLKVKRKEKKKIEVGLLTCTTLIDNIELRALYKTDFTHFKFGLYKI